MVVFILMFLLIVSLVSAGFFSGTGFVSLFDRMKKKIGPEKPEVNFEHSSQGCGDGSCSFIEKTFKTCPNDCEQNLIALNSINIKNYGAYGDGNSHQLIYTDIINNPQWLGVYNVGDEWDSVAIQEAILNADSGKNLFFPPGTYLIYLQDLDGSNKGITLKSNLNFIGDKAKLQGFPANSVKIKSQSTNNNKLENVQFRDLIFSDLSFYLGATDHWTTNHITFKNCKFTNTVSTNQVYYIHLGYTSDILIDNCKFERNIINEAGKGISLYRNHNITITNSEFTGYLKTAINIYGSMKQNNDYPIGARNYNITINNNKLERINGYTVLNDGTVDIIYSEDHGIYAWGMKNISIINNEISGWSPTSYGGCIKIRNGENILIENNLCYDSGMKTYTYTGTNDCNLNDSIPDVSSCPPPFFKNVIINNNVFFIDPNPNYFVSEINRCKGIVYWRNFLGETPPNYEDEIIFSNNVINNGCIRIENSEGSEFTVQNNSATEYVYNVNGINEYNNIII